MIPDEHAGGETILLVEDEEILRNMLREILQRSGYRVLPAGNGLEALEIVKGGEKPDLVLTDVVMPKMNGRQLAENLVQIHRGLKIIFMSGYTDDEEVVKGITATPAAFLQKPFAPSLLLKKLKESLTSPPLQIAGKAEK